MNYIDSFQPDSDGMYKQSVLYAPQQLRTMLNDAEQEIQANLSDASACLKKANVLMSMGRFDEAHMFYERTIWLDPRSAFSYLGLSILFRSRSLFTDAKIYCNRAVQLAPKSSLALVERAMILFEQNLEITSHMEDASPASRKQLVEDASEGLKVIEYALQLDSKNVMGAVAKSYAERLLKWQSLFGMGKHNKAALDECDRAIKLDPLLSEAYFAKAGALIDQKLFLNALSPINRFTELAPYDAKGYYIKHIILQRLGRKEDATKTLLDGVVALSMFESN
jgi:tetratricopeptide (TPR) repeat protein